MEKILCEVRDRALWSIKQIFTIRYIVAMTIFILIFAISGSEIPIEKLVLTIVFICFCTYKQLGTSITISIIIGIIVGIFPFVGFLIPILMVVAICMLPLLFMSILIPAIISELSTLVSTVEYNNYINANPGIHNVRAYTRVNSGGQIEHVRSHIRTNPDGIEVNNLSYKPD